jgi:PAS domain S-box-containing protein
MIAGLDGLVKYVNPQLSAMSGYSREELAAMGDTNPDRTASEKAGIALALEAAREGHSSARESPLARKDGAPLWERATVLPIRDAAGRVESVVTLTEDITEYKEKQIRLSDSEASARMITAVAVAANAAKSIGGILAVALRKIARYAGWELGHAYLSRLLEDGSTRFQPSGIWYLEDQTRFAEFVRVTAGTTLAQGEGLIGKIRGVKPRWVEKVAEDRQFVRRESAAEAGITSACLVPVVVGERTFAVLEFFTTRDLHPSESLLNHVALSVFPLQIAIARLSAEEKSGKLSEIIEQGPSAVVTRDETGLIDYVNSRFSEMTGYAAEEVVGKAGEALERALPNRGAGPGIEEAARAGVVWKGDILDTRKDGSRFWERRTVFPVLGADERLLSIVTIMDDITEMKRIEASLVEAKVEAERANRTKSDFLARMSHEIRTPLNAVIGLASLAIKREREPRQHDYLRKIQLSSSVLLELIDDILDFSKIEAGKIEIERVPFDLEEALRKLCTIVSMKARDKGLEIVISIVRDLPRHIVGDPHRLNQVLLNLLNNAVKFTDRGEILLSVSVVERSDHHAKLRFSVGDTGIGMSEEQLGRLFRPFVQAEGTIARRYGGTGLGLAICKQLVELMGGSISATSEPGAGSEFSFLLPFVFVEEPGMSLASLAELRDAPILIVEDSEAASASLKYDLESFAMRPTAAGSGEEALVLLEEARLPFGLLLIDTRLPGMDGLETLRRARRLNAGQGAIAIIMGYDYERDETMAKAAGLDVSGFLEKPISPSPLIDALMNAIAERPSGDRLGREAAAWATREPDEFGGVEVLLAEDNEINQQVAYEILESVGIAVDVARNGAEAIKMLEAGHYDAVLMDIQMPEMDGIAATRIIKADPRLRRNLVIAMTADVFAAGSKEFKDAGFDDCVFKPIDERQLFDTLAKRLGRRRETGVAAPSGAVPPGATARVDIPELPGVDIRSGLERVLWNRDLYRRVLFKFRQSEGPGAGLILEAIERGDLERARKLAHALKGSSGNVSALGLHDRLEELEACLREGRLEAAREKAGEAIAESRRVIEAIGAWQERTERERGEGSEADSPARGLDPALVEASMERLRLQLVGSDTEAIDSFSSLKRILGKPGAGVERELRRIDESLAAYEFDAAAEALASLKEKLKLIPGSEGPP